MSEEKKRPRRLMSRFYAVRTTAGQEMNVAMLIYNRVRAAKLDVKAIIVPPNAKGYVILEAPGPNVVYNAIQELKHVKGLVPGVFSDDDIKRALIPKSPLIGLKEGDIVEIIAGPFRGMKAKIIRVDVAKNEAVLNILESSYPLQIMVSGDYVKPVRKQQTQGGT